MSMAFEPQTLALPFQPLPVAAAEDEDEAAGEGAFRRGGGGGGVDMDAI